jgi:HK97 gp10 family phage protein
MSVQSEFKSFMREVERDILKMDKELRDQAADVVMTEIRQSLESQTGDTPKTVTGNLKKGLSKKNGKWSSIVGFKSPAHHAALVEFGGDLVTHGKKISGGRKPHPFLKPAFERKQGEIIRILSQSRTE